MYVVRTRQTDRPPRRLGLGLEHSLRMRNDIVDMDQLEEKEMRFRQTRR